MKKIRIVFLHWCLVCGGAERALFDLVTLLDKNRFDITVFTIFGGGEWEWRFQEAGVRVINSYSCVERGKTIWEKLKNRRKAGRIAKILKQGGTGLLEECGEDNYDIIVSFHLGNGFSNIGLSNRAKTIRYIHGDVSSNDELRLELEKLSLLAYDKVICVSQYARQSVYAQFGELTNLCVCHNPINSDEIIQLAQEPTDVKSPYICSVGRLTEAKGYVRLVRIFHKLKQSGAQCRLVIVGEGPERSNIENTIKECHLQGDVILTGFRQNPYPYIKNALFTVCSSYTEGLHLASLESLCLGVPVISIFPTIQELLGDEPCGIVVDTESDLLEGMQRMLGDTTFYAKLREAAKRRSLKISSKAMIEKVENEYISVLN